MDYTISHIPVRNAAHYHRMPYQSGYNGGMPDAHSEEFVMSPLRIANAPCSWGTLEFAGLSGERITYTQMLDELVATGYVGTELGDWGFMPTNPHLLADELARRQLTLIGAFVPVPLLSDATAVATATSNALRTADLLAQTAARLNQSHQPLQIGRAHV